MHVEAQTQDQHTWRIDLLIGVGLILLTVIFFWKIALTNLILPGVDVFTYFYPYRAYASEALRSLDLPLWNPYLFLGVPFLANPQTAVFYPPNWLLIGLSAPKQIAWSIVGHTALAALLAYTYARRSLSLAPLHAGIAAVTFAFGGFLGAQAEHVNQLNVSAWFPALLLLWDLWEEHPKRSAIGLSLLIGLGLLAGHTQASFISLTGLFLYAITTAPWSQKEAKWKPLAQLIGRLLLVTAIGTLLAAVQLIPTLELSSHSIRSGGLTYREAIAFSLKPRTFLYTFLPSFGENLAAAFGEEAFTEYIAWIGVIALGLAFLGARTSHRRRTALLLLALTGWLLAWGGYNPLYYLLYRLVPGFGLFRAPARWLFLYAFGSAMLTGLGLQALRYRTLPHLPRPIAALIAGVALLAALTAARGILARPTLTTLAGWCAGAIALTLILLLAHRGQPRWAWSLAAILIPLELFLASRSLPYNHPTAPEALTSMRTAPAHLLAVQHDQIVPDRFLSMSDILYDPGDLEDIRRILSDQLPEPSIYDFIVCTKRKEVLAPNLPLIWHIPAVDGYDGGVLPLKRYVDLQHLFLSPERISPDGRLREQLQRIPPARLLSLLNVRYVITDKVNDVWIDGVFYDLAHEALLPANMRIATDDLPSVESTAVGIVSYLEGATDLPDGTPVAAVRLIDEDGEIIDWTLRAGIETAEGLYTTGEIRHAMAQVGHHPRENPQIQEYVARLSWETPRVIQRIEVTGLAPQGTFHLRGLTLIDERLGTGEPVILSTSGHFRLVHSGDVKIYENLDALPRAYIVPRTLTVPDEENALEALSDPQFNPAQYAIVEGGSPGETTLGGGGTAQITRYAPEEIEIQIESAGGMLVLSDTWYPGWEATVDGVPTAIERVNLLMRGIPVPEGNHLVRLTYRPRSFRIGAITSIATLLIGLLYAVGLWARRRRRDGKDRS